jgi:transposase
MSQKHSYFRFTTPQQRKLLFETWEATDSVTKACQVAHVGRATFYYWKPRFDQYGYPGLEEFQSRVAHKLNRKSEALEQRVVDMHDQHPEWGKQRIADELAKENNWVPIITVNTVRRILQAFDLWPANPKAGRKKSLPTIQTKPLNNPGKRST